MNIIIAGDSFSADQTESSWVSMLKKQYFVTNLSQRGISEYRLYRTIIKNLEIINQADILLVFHTSPTRVFIPDGVPYPARKLHTHLGCDLVANDALESDWEGIAKMYYKNFYDESFQQDMFNLMVSEIQRLVTAKIIHFSGFDISSVIDIQSIADVKRQHPGSVNHLSDAGNSIVFNYIIKRITNCGC